MFNLNSGNGGAVNGRGLHHRKLSHKQRVTLAADVVIGEKPFEPSQAQYCSLFGITPAALRAELKVRAAANGNGLSEQVKQLVGLWASLSQSERVKAFQTIGTAEVWDALVSAIT